MIKAERAPVTQGKARSETMVDDELSQGQERKEQASQELRSERRSQTMAPEAVRALRLSPCSCGEEVAFTGLLGTPSTLCFGRYSGVFF